MKRFCSCVDRITGFVTLDPVILKPDNSAPIYLLDGYVTSIHIQLADGICGLERG